MIRYSELISKDVINVRDGCNYGSIDDLDIDIESGEIRAIIIPVSKKLLGMFASDEEYIIPWRKIICIGEDAILVDVCEDKHDDKKC